MGISIWVILAAALVVLYLVGGRKGALAAVTVLIAAVIAVTVWNAVVSGPGVR